MSVDRTEVPLVESVKYLDIHLTPEMIEKDVYFIRDDDGVNNAVYEIDGEKYRVRVETFVKRKMGEETHIFYQKQKKENHYGTHYKIPGGSIEEDRTLAQQAEAECNEEILAKVANVQYTGICYVNKYDPKTIPQWHKDILWPQGLVYVGAITFVFTADYVGPYRKHIDDHDKDDLSDKGNWHSLEEFNKLRATAHEGIAMESSKVVIPTAKSEADRQIIIDSFSEKEKKIWGTSPRDIQEKERKATVFQKILYDDTGTVPTAFVNLTDSGKLGLADGDVNLSIAVHSDYRKKGLAKSLVKDAVRWFKDSDYQTLTWIADDENEASQKLAKDCGFVHMEHWKDKHQHFYMITNPSMLSVIGEATSAGKGFCLPVDYSKFKSDDSRVICINTHLLNVLYSGATFWVPLLTGWDVILGGKALFSTLVHHSVSFLPLSAYMVLDQLFAVDFCVMGPDKKEKFTFTNGILGYDVLAIENGEVVETDDSIKDHTSALGKVFMKYGNFIVIKHGNFYSSYCHLKKGSLKVKVGDRVRKGQVIAKVGHSGASSDTQAHLHFEMCYTRIPYNKNAIPMPIYDLPKMLRGFKKHDYAPIANVDALNLWNPFSSYEGFIKAFDDLELKPNTTGEIHWACFLTEPPKKKIPTSESMDVIAFEYYEGINLSEEEFKQGAKSTNAWHVINIARHGEEITEDIVRLHKDEDGKITYTLKDSKKFPEYKSSAAHRMITWANSYSSALKFSIKGDEIVATEKKPIKEAMFPVVEMASIDNSYEVDLDEESVKKFKLQYKGLSHVRIGEDYQGKLILVKDNGKENVVGFINVRKSDGMIQALEMSDQYRGKGGGTELLKIAERLGANQLTVNVNNNVAHDMYKKNGWSDTKIVGKMQYMVRDGSHLAMELASIDSLGLNETHRLEALLETVQHSDAVYEFYRQYNTPWQLMNGLRKVGARWPNKAESKKMRGPSHVIWPEQILSGKPAVCNDYAILEHYWAEYHHLENYIMILFSLPENMPKAMCGHAVLVVKFQEKWYILDYHARAVDKSIKHAKKIRARSLGPEVVGPYNSKNALVEVYMEDFNLLINDVIYKGKAKLSNQYYLLDNSQIGKVFDEDYGDTAYTQDAMLSTRFGYYFRDLVDYAYSNSSSNMGVVVGKFFHFTDLLYSTYDSVTGMFESVEDFDPIGEMEITMEDVKFSLYTKKYKDLKEFCKYMETPQDACNWYQLNRVHWPTDEKGSEDPFHWPDEIIKTKCGCCFDHAIFMHYFCKSKGIESTLLRIVAWTKSHQYEGNDPGVSYWFTHGHMVCIYHVESGWFAFNYVEPNEKSLIQTNLYGPFETQKKLVESYSNMYYETTKIIMGMRFNYKGDMPHWHYVYTKSDLSKLDAIYGNKSIGRDEWSIKEDIDQNKKYDQIASGKMRPVEGYNADPFDVIQYEAKKFGVNILDRARAITKKLMKEASEYVPEYKEELQPVQESGTLKNPEVGISSITDLILSVLDKEKRLDIKEFATTKSGKRFMYTRCKVMNKFVPLVIFLSYCEGLTTVMRKANIRFEFSDTRPRLDGYDAVNRGVIPFADGYVIFDKYPLENSLLMNGLAVMDTKSVEYADMDSKDVYVNLFDVLYGARMLANALDNFYEWMIDPVTFTILEDLNYPTDFVGLMLAGNKLMSDNNFVDEISMKNWRIRKNEMVYAESYKRIAEAYTRFRMTSNNRNPVKISIPRDQVIKSIMQSQVVEDVSELSPVIEVKKANTITDQGPSGTNLKEAYTMKRRCYHDTMLGVMAISTSPDANVGIKKDLTVEPNVMNARGYVKEKEDRDMEEPNLFSMVELLTPGSATQDDQVRLAMESKQSKFCSFHRVIYDSRCL